MTEHGDVLWSELISGDVAASKAFFTEICGWSINEMPMPGGMIYNVCMNGDRPVAGIMSVDVIREQNPEAQPHWMTYLHVDDVDGSAKAAAANGGTVLSEPFDVEGVGRICIVMDPGQAVVGIMTPAQQG